MTDVHTPHTNEPRIVAGFDNTSSGFDAIALGRDLAEATGARMIVAHVYPAGTITAADVAIDPRFGQSLRDQVRRHLDGAGPALEGFRRWDGVLQTAATAARGLHEIAEEQAADMVVVGSTHCHGLGRVMPGTTAGPGAAASVRVAGSDT